MERTFAWLGKYRRLSKNYEYHTDTSEAMIYVAMIHLMVQRIAVKTPLELKDSTPIQECLENQNRNAVPFPS